MTFRSVLIHLRIPFSWLLLPVYLFALTSHPDASPFRAIAVFFILHFLLYPASNAFNSWCDRDKGPIGLIEKPPPVTRTLLWTALCLDAAALACGFAIRPLFGVFILLYGIFSKAYSHDSVRLKKFPVASFLAVGLGQGGATYLMCLAGLTDSSPAVLAAPLSLAAAGISTLLIWGVYPLSQVYQHAEDRARGDRTVSMLLGVKGTFAFSAVFFGLAAAGFFLWYAVSGRYALGFALLAFLAPGLSYFAVWLSRVLRDVRKADWRSAMAFNLAASTGLNAFFLLLLILRGF